MRMSRSGTCRYFYRRFNRGAESIADDATRSDMAGNLVGPAGDLAVRLQSAGEPEHDPDKPAWWRVSRRDVEAAFGREYTKLLRKEAMIEAGVA